MKRGKRITIAELASRLETLDVDEGMRIESAGKKMFVNRNASGIFVVQFGEDFYYFDFSKQVFNAINSKFGGRYAVWAY